MASLTRRTIQPIGPGVSPPGRGNVPLRRSTPPGVGNLPPDPNVFGGAALAGGVVDPNWRPPVKPPVAPVPPPTQPPPIVAPPSAPPPRTFQPPAPPVAPVRDPRIEELLRQLSGGGGSSKSSATLNLSGINAQSAQLQALIAQLMRGEGISTPDMSNDPAAQAFSLTKRREEERAREGEAAALGASGVAGSGDFDGRVAQLREQTGQSIAENNADLTNKRRSEALGTAMSGAQLQLSDLDRQTRGKQAEYDSKVNQERTASGERAALLQALLGREGADKDRHERALALNASREDREREYTRSAADREREAARVQAERRYGEQREDPMEALRRQLMEQDVEERRRQLQQTSDPYRRGGSGVPGGYGNRPVVYGR